MELSRSTRNIIASAKMVSVDPDSGMLRNRRTTVWQITG